MMKITIPELKELCKKNGLKGYSKMNKAQLIEYVSAYADAKKSEEKKKKPMKGKGMIGYGVLRGKDFYGAGFLDTLKSIAKKIPFAEIANVSLTIAQDFLPKGKAKDIVDIAADISQKIVKEKERQKKEDKPIDKEEKFTPSLPNPRNKKVLKTKKMKKSKQAKKY